ncbi:unnamed protein product [Didymodactylos carnosus]|uniref:Coronin n=1 Tax=Didymodactylos carnosus TaxID=1234261 RepID=A0A813Z771_9BILA|nr:unnamed protein product [Didymodactylos carnosus]CAF3677975.1 unnamed protein product [Didymodactylos carnosus]
MPFKVRISKFRHVYGSPYREDCCYKNIPITRNAHDGGFCAVNGKFLAIVTETSGGGSFLVLQLSEVGRVDVDHFRVTGHRGPVVDIKWNPFNDNEIASCSDDGTVKVWYIPDSGLRNDMYQWKVDLHGHQRRVDYVEWHPTAQNLILSAGLDHQVVLWNVERAEPIHVYRCHPDSIQSITWNRNGTLFATTCKDKRIRVIEPRSGRVVADGIGHQGPKTSKIVFLGDAQRLLSTGFGKTFERQIGIWNVNDLSKPVLMETVDFSAGALIPFYDHDTRTVYLAGKGDGNIRYYEVGESEPYLHFLSEYKSASPQRCLGVMPKVGLDVTKNEIMRFYKLFATGSICEPISMIVPRKAEAFQIDIYPDTPGPYPALSADEWINGCDREPILVSMKDRTETNMPKITTYRTIEPSSSQTPPSAQRNNHLHHSTRTVPPPVAEIAPTLINKTIAHPPQQHHSNNDDDLDLEKRNNKINLEKNGQQQETSPTLKPSVPSNNKGLRKIESLKMPSNSTEFNNVSVNTPGRPHLYKTLHSVHSVNHTRSAPDLSDHCDPAEELKSYESSSSIENLCEQYTKSNREPLNKRPNKPQQTVERDQHASAQPSSILKRSVTQTHMREGQLRPLLNINMDDTPRFPLSYVKEPLITSTIFSPSAAAYFKDEHYDNVDVSLPKQETSINNENFKSVFPSIENEKQVVTSIPAPKRKLRSIKLAAQRSFTEPFDFGQKVNEIPFPIPTTPVTQTDVTDGDRSQCVKASRSMRNTDGGISTNDSKLNRSFSFHHHKSELPAVDLNIKNREKFLNFNDAKTSQQQQENRRNIEIKKKVWSVDSTTTNNNGSDHSNGYTNNGIDYRQAFMKQQEELKSVRELLTLKDNRIRLLEDELSMFKTETEGNYR